jgi:oleate hydratase
MTRIPNTRNGQLPSKLGVDGEAARTYLVGGGIASLSAAAFLIRDGDLKGETITILEESGVVGGSLDGSGSAEKGYVLRGGRMFESKYVCTFELFDSIPTLEGTRTVTQEIIAWNETLRTASKSRFMVDGHRQEAPRFGLSERHILTIERLALEPEVALGRSRIVDQFDPTFFKTDFWSMWCTTFAFQPWHGAVEFKRYLVRFVHMVDGFDRLKGILRTVYNQYDSLVRPLRKWLDERGVVFALNTTVIDLLIVEVGGLKTVEQIVFQRGGQSGEILVGQNDRVLVTLGSMTEGSSLGSMDTAPVLDGKAVGGAWALWEAIASGRPEFGNPGVFSDHVDQSKWVSFTVTLNDPALLRIAGDLTGNVPGEGGLITFPQSSWLASIVIPHQPHFI